MNALISLENFALQPMDGKILDLNEVSREYGLVLSAEDARDLSEIRERSLRENERLEIGLGAMEGVIRRFSQSAFVNQENYAYIIGEITDLFYYIKTETDDKISDNELLDEMYLRFEQRCRGSMDLLIGREAEVLIRKINAGENYKRWFGQQDNLDNNRDTDLVNRRDASGGVIPVLADEDRGIYRDLEGSWTGDADMNDMENSREGEESDDGSYDDQRA